MRQSIRRFCTRGPERGPFISRRSRAAKPAASRIPQTPLPVPVCSPATPLLTGQLPQASSSRPNPDTSGKCPARLVTRGIFLKTGQKCAAPDTRNLGALPRMRLPAWRLWKPFAVRAPFFSRRHSLSIASGAITHLFFPLYTTAGAFPGHTMAGWRCRLTNLAFQRLCERSQGWAALLVPAFAARRRITPSSGSSSLPFSCGWTSMNL